MPSTTQAVSLGVIILFVAFVFPMFISAPDSGVNEATITFNDGDDGIEQIEEALHLQLVNKTTTSVTVNVTSIETGDRQQIMLSDTETTSITLDEANLTISAVEIGAEPTEPVTLTVSYPYEFGWQNNSSDISSQLPLVFAALGAIIVAGILGAMLK